MQFLPKLFYFWVQSITYISILWTNVFFLSVTCVYVIPEANYLFINVSKGTLRELISREHFIPLFRGIRVVYVCHLLTGTIVSLLFTLKELITFSEQ